MNIRPLHALAKCIFPLLPQSDLLYRACRRYVDQCDGQNNDEIHSNGELALMRKVLPHCKTVFDVGANVGKWTRLALGIKPDLSIHCFEPSCTTFAALAENVFPSGVTCNNFGLGSSQGTANMCIYAEAGGTNSLYHRQGVALATANVPVGSETVGLETFDRYCEREGITQVDFVKIDVEGHELAVMTGMNESLRRRRVGMIQFEYGGCDIDSRVFLKDIWSLFDGLPYCFYKIHPRGLRKAPEYGQQFENFQCQNWVIVREGVRLHDAEG